MPKILASDLDGTLIPLPGNDSNRTDLHELARLFAENEVELVFVTGRHLASIERSIARESLPTPNWIIGDIGTSIYRRSESGKYEMVEAYQSHLAEIAFPLDDLRERLAKNPKLRFQEPEKQGRFKLSFYTDADDLPPLVEELEAMLQEESIDCTLIHSNDPFTHGGLIDFLPQRVSKAYALAWWQHHSGVPREEIVFAGDSGNDLAAFLAGYRTIVVRNTKWPLPRTVFDAHRRNGWLNRFFYSTRPATSGVLEGCRYFGLIPSVTSPSSQKLGAFPITAVQTEFHVWAPKNRTVQVHVETTHGAIQQKMTPDEKGYHHVVLDQVGPGDRYYYELDNGQLRPDPVSYYQPDGVHKSSMVVDHRVFPWGDAEWKGIAKKDLIIYELHVGTFTEEGTFQGVIRQLDYLRDLGITAIELMPVAQSPGRWNWGYDGVNSYAPRNTYGSPDDLKALVDAAHEAGIAVLLDVVYNHLGPEGNYMAEFAPYFSEKHHTPWGSAFNVDDPLHAGPVRSYLIENSLYWLREYHLDGLRLDAIHFIQDDSTPHITRELAEAVARFKQEVGRTIHLIAEANVYDKELIDSGTEDQSGFYDASWCDDIMHAVYSVTAPDIRLAHREYVGPTDLEEALQHGYIYANLGDYEAYTRVTEADRKAFQTDISKDYLSSFVVAVQTHDVIGNHPRGKRIHHLTSREAQKAVAALILLYPTIPMLFMGEEHAADSLFPFFADFTDQHLRNQVDEGRRREYSHHDWSDSPLPSQAETFQAAVMAAREEDNPVHQWYRSLLHVRRESVRQGWITPENLEVSTDIASSLYQLHYKRDGKIGLTVVARISDPRKKRAPIELSTSGTILLDSRRSDAAGTKIESGTPIQIHLSHAVVLRHD